MVDPLGPGVQGSSAKPQGSPAAELHRLAPEEPSRGQRIPLRTNLRDHGYDPDGGRGQLAWDRVLAPFLDAEEVTPPVEVTFDEMKQHPEKLRLVVTLGMSRELLVLPPQAGVRVPEAISVEYDREIFKRALELYILENGQGSQMERNKPTSLVRLFVRRLPI